jgi:hypothetical protein
MRQSSRCQVTRNTACPNCEALERQCDDVVRRIREVLEERFRSLGDKVRELHRWQEERDETFEVFYSHKRIHRQLANVPRRAVA